MLFFPCLGQLNAVSNLKRTLSNITWNPPFSLNLTNVESDIIYCVEVYSTTCGDNAFLFGNCSVTQPFYVSSMLNNGLTYNITVTPRSYMNGAQSGNALTRQGKLSLCQSHSNLKAQGLSMADHTWSTTFRSRTCNIVCYVSL